MNQHPDVLEEWVAHVEKVILEKDALNVQKTLWSAPLPLHVYPVQVHSHDFKK